jgi:hypothetical protein
MLRRRELVRLLPGVFVDHTGEPSWRQRAVAGCLYYQPAVLAGASALRAVIGSGWRHHDERAPIEISIDHARRRSALPGYAVGRIVGLNARAQWNTSPPRTRVEDAALDVAARQATELDTIGILADVCQSRRTTARRIIAALDRRPRLSNRAWLRSVLSDIGDGTCSTLEHGYLVRVERPHGLPSPRRQAVASIELGRARRDVDYDPHPLLVELDGRLFHDSAQQRDLDLDRDLDAAVDGRHTVRLGWGQVFGRPCRTAARIAALLAQRGWSGVPRRCGPTCEL